MYGSSGSIGSSSSDSFVAKQVQELLLSQSALLPPSLASMTEATTHQPDVSTMMKHIDTNLVSPLHHDNDDADDAGGGGGGILWEDERSDILEEILHRSLNR